MPPVPHDDHRTLARLVIGPRAALEGCYDTQNTLAGSKAEVFKVVAIDATDDRDAYARAFAAAEEGQWLHKFVRIGVEAGLLDGKALMVGAQSANQPEAIIVQGMVNAARGLTEPLALAGGILQTIRRICRVIIDDGAVTGTGFLVGPQTVLTAWHVVRSLLDRDGRPIQNSATHISVEFDRIDGNGAQQALRVKLADAWLGNSSPAHASELQGAVNGQLIGTSAPQFGQLAECFDFAVLRLKATPGRDRGYVRLNSECSPPPDQRIYVFQHPLEFNQRMDFALGAKFDPGDRGRFRFFHDANTLGGSSGGLCVNEQFEAVGLHQAGQFNAQGVPTRNRAIPISHIAKHCGDVLDVNVEDDPVWCLRDRRTPVFGRETFQRLVWQAVRGDIRVIQVNGSKDGGKSFSLELMTSMLAANNHLIVSRSAANVSSNAEDFAAALLRDIEPSNAPAAPTPLPRPAASGTTQSAYVQDQLLPVLLPRLVAAAGERMLWVVIDELDRHDITPGSTRELLDALYARLPTLPYLRFVLLGTEGFLGAVNSQLVGTERLERVLETDLDTQLRRRYVAAQQPVPDNTVPVRQLLRTADLLGGRTARHITEAYLKTVAPDLPPLPPTE